jgi:hypothetical protein
MKKNAVLFVAFIAFLWMAMKWLTIGVASPLTLLVYAGGTFFLGGVVIIILFQRRGKPSRIGLAAEVFYRVL